MADSKQHSGSGKFGIRGALPAGDTMGLAHLLGDDFSWARWYPTALERDQAYEEMTRPHPYYRAGDRPSVELEKVER